MDDVKRTTAFLVEHNKYIVILANDQPVAMYLVIEPVTSVVNL